jgi:hypothetical protein
MGTPRKSPATRFLFQPIGPLRYGDREYGRELAPHHSVLGADRRPHASDRPVGGQDRTIWRWTRAPPTPGARWRPTFELSKRPGAPFERTRAAAGSRTETAGPEKA